MEVKIYQQRDGKVNEADRQQLAALLIKFGYTVRIGKERKDGSKANTYYVAYKGDEK